MDSITPADLTDSTNLLITEQLLAEGWSLTRAFIDESDCRELYLQAERFYQQHQMVQAGIGRSQGFRIDRKIRSDHVIWLDPKHTSGAQERYFNKLESLKTCLNQSLFLGLFDLECHMAIYPVGAYYTKHLDCFQANSLRTLTCILYLNQDWHPAEGGQLRLYTQVDDDTHYVDIYPVAGQFLTFLSARFRHEVLPTRRQRASISGWFKRHSFEVV